MSNISMIQSIFRQMFGRRLPAHSPAYRSKSSCSPLFMISISTCFWFHDLANMPFCTQVIGHALVSFRFVSFRSVNYDLVLLSFACPVWMLHSLPHIVASRRSIIHLCVSVCANQNGSNYYSMNRCTFMRKINESSVE